MPSSSASTHDCRAAIPLSLTSAQRVDSLYDVMDTAECIAQIQEHCRVLEHEPLIDNNPRGGREESSSRPTRSATTSERSGEERSNARLKDEFGGRTVRVRGHSKVASHPMFGITALSADQFPRLHRRD